jgi:hypothetical protein
MKDDRDVIWAESMYGAKLGKGLVTISFRNERVTVTPREAKAVAVSILEAANAAEFDEVFMRWLEKTGMLDERISVHALRELRELRKGGV